MIVLEDQAIRSTATTDVVVSLVTLGCLPMCIERRENNSKKCVTETGKCSSPCNVNIAREDFLIPLVVVLSQIKGRNLKNIY